MATVNLMFGRRSSGWVVKLRWSATGSCWGSQEIDESSWEAEGQNDLHRSFIKETDKEAAFLRLFNAFQVFFRGFDPRATACRRDDLFGRSESNDRCFCWWLRDRFEDESSCKYVSIGQLDQWFLPNASRYFSFFCSYSKLGSLLFVLLLLPKQAKAAFSVGESEPP